MKLSRVQKAVESTLITDPRTRDCDFKLIAEIWRVELRKQSLGDCNEFFDILLSGRLSPPESITRCRRKIQEENEGLRGKSYYQKQHATEDMKRQIRMF